MQQRRERNGWTPALVAVIAWSLCANMAVAEADTPLAAAYRPLGAAELEDLVAPVALYPDDLLAIVLPASTFPLQVVEAGRYLDAVADDASLSPDADWDASVVALLNYPEVVDKLSGDLDWTWNLGQAVINQEQDVLAAVERFRREVQAAGNLRSDAYQRVEDSPQALTIRPADPEVIYVPDYEPAQVVVWQSGPVLDYYPRPCPVYYYPYPAGDYRISGLRYPFWGVTSVFSIVWTSHVLAFHTLDQPGHPYYGHRYAVEQYHYWRPRLMGHRLHRYHDGRWHPDRHRQGARPSREPWQEPMTGVPAPPPARRETVESFGDRRDAVTSQRFQRPARIPPASSPRRQDPRLVHRQQPVAPARSRQPLPRSDRVPAAQLQRPAPSPPRQPHRSSPQPRAPAEHDAVEAAKVRAERPPGARAAGRGRPWHPR